MATNSIEPRQGRNRNRQLPQLGGAFDRWFRDFDDMFDLAPLVPALSGLRDMSMALDLHETDESYVVAIDMPGIDKSDIDIDVSGNILTVRGERREEIGSAEKGRSSYSERRFGEFSRSFTLPADATSESIEASYDNGVLHVVIPKTSEAKRRKISIKETGKFLDKIRHAVTSRPAGALEAKDQS